MLPLAVIIAPLLLMVVAVSEPVPPIVMVPLLVTVVAVIAPVLPNVMPWPLLTVTNVGVLATEEFIVIALFTVTVAPAGGGVVAPVIPFSSQVAFVFQSVAAFVIYPKKVNDGNVPGAPEVVTLTVPDAPVVNVHTIDVAVLETIFAAVPPKDTAVAPERLVPVMVILCPA